METFSDPIIKAIAKAIDDSTEIMKNIYKDKIACRILSSPPFEFNSRKVKSSPKRNANRYRTAPMKKFLYPHLAFVALTLANTQYSIINYCCVVHINL